MKKMNMMYNESATRRGEPMCTPGYTHATVNQGRHAGLPLRWMAMAMMALAFTSCSNDDDTLTAEQEITLTTPVIQLDGVAASATRAAQSLTDVASNAMVSAIINLYLHDTEAREMNYDRNGQYISDENWTWYATPSVTVTDGEGHYRAGISTIFVLKETADMPAIKGPIYAYRGSINVRADGTFTPDGTLQPYSVAVLLHLKDADGNSIAPDGKLADGAKLNSEVYYIKPVGLAKMNGFVSMDAEGNVDWNAQYFPNGTADPVPDALTWSPYPLTSTADGNFTPGTYPATWEEYGPLVTSAVPTTAWPLFEVTYCRDGFEQKEVAQAVYDYVPLGPATTWTVNYPAGQQLTLEAGKLYTFTATLGADAHITLDADEAVSISDWSEGETINVGR